MDEKFTKPYDPQATEGRIYQEWEASGFFNPDNLPARHRDPFTIIMPPPNANGHLHAGHSLFITLEDIMTRYKRMRGYKALWVPGADHAGFETQIVYEKKLEKEGRSRFGMDPQDLYKEIYDFTIENKKYMEDEVKRMGASCDWSREKFTLDPEVVKEVQKTFEKMYHDKLVFRGKRIINWCPKHQTTLSDVETTTEEKQDKFYYLQYGPFVIATARPETKFGDKYVVMHPDDARYAQYKHGDTFEAEWINGPITATIIKDDVIDMEFGTGVMTITPWHDAIDFAIAERHNLPKEQVIDFRGKLLDIAGEFAGMKIAEARPKIVEKLEAKGLLVKVEENYKHNVPCCYKCNTVIEPQVMDQWFVKMEPLAKLALDAVDAGKIKFVPDNYEKIFRYWMSNTIDWNISRQIVWGIPIPVWYKTQVGTKMEAVHFDKNVLYNKLGLKDDADFNNFSDKFLLDEDKKISWVGPDSQGIVQLHVGYISLLKERNYFDDAWINSHRINHPQIEPEIHVGSEPPESIGWVQDTDTFDTWFSSGQWTLLSLGYSQGEDWKKFHPTDVMETGHDLIFKWVPRMVIFSLYLQKEVPFHTVYLHGLVNDAQGRKMSKSKGNVINPIEIIDKYGTDALRMALIVGNTPGMDSALAEPKIKGYKNFANKLWNISRFVFMSTEGIVLDESQITAEADKKLIAELDTLIAEVTADFDNYRFHLVAEKTYHYVWHQFADAILEESKPIFAGDDQQAKVSRQQTLLLILKQSLVLLHPFMPFVTEEIWSHMPIQNKKLLMIEEWPQ